MSEEKRPVQLIAVHHKIRNDYGVLYTPATAIDCLDLNAPKCAFERAQVNAGVLKIVSEGLADATKDDGADAKAAEEQARLEAEEAQRMENQAAEQARLEAEEQARLAAEEQARLEAGKPNKKS